MAVTSTSTDVVNHSRANAHATNHTETDVLLLASEHVCAIVAVSATDSMNAFLATSVHDAIASKPIRC